MWHRVSPRHHKEWQSPSGGWYADKWRDTIVNETIQTVLKEHPELITVANWSDVPLHLKRYIISICNRTLTVAERLRGKQ